MAKAMKIACLYWPTSSVGGIATNVMSLRNEAKRRGDIFHAFVSANVKSHQFAVYDKPKRIRGGDTFIDIDGYASHHKDRFLWSAKRLNEYDVIYLTHMCPHATKAYGQESLFLPLLQLLNKPIIGNVPDGYWDTYQDWGREVAKLCTRIIVATPPYTPDDLKTDEFYKGTLLYGYGFDPISLEFPRDTERSMVWVSQWKAIKGIHKFLHLLPKIEGKQDLYSNGILYYQKRTEPEWQAAVGTDAFLGFSGSGRATFHGWQPPVVIREALCRAWFMPEFQGLGRPKNIAYQNGSINNTIKEALYYGCTPVIPQMTIDTYNIPSESCYGVKDFNDSIRILNGSMAPRPELGKQWVMDNYAINKIYDSFFGGL